MEFFTPFSQFTRWYPRVNSNIKYIFRAGNRVTRCPVFLLFIQRVTVIELSRQLDSVCISKWHRLTLAPADRTGYFNLIHMWALLTMPCRLRCLITLGKQIIFYLEYNLGCTGYTFYLKSKIKLSAGADHHRGMSINTGAFNMMNHHSIIQLQYF